MAKDSFPHAKIEKKWRERWVHDETYRTREEAGKPKKYVLDMFPYPSGEGLHVGHPKGYIATDVFSRHARMTGHQVLHPMGWDAFGLPAENYALKHKVHPREAVEKNIARYKSQLEHIGFDYDWSREINTTDPSYYHWTQWIFIKMFEHGLAFQSDEPINWCPSCKTGLANEDLEGNVCERCGTVVEKKKLPQWVLKITDYADRMLADLDMLDWPEHIKESQKNWIGRSEGAEIDFAITNGGCESKEKITVFTTRPDTLLGVTYIVLAPEHSLLANEKFTTAVTNLDSVRAYASKAVTKTEIERGAEGKEKTGVKIDGVMAVNPANGEEVPIFVADYVLGSYGTGAVMAVPAHDERDEAFADKFALPTKIADTADEDTLTTAGARKVVKYKLRDWVFSRQRYWGEPIPIIHCAKCGAVPVPYEDLPVVLPDVESYEPTGTGESPLAAIDEWINVSCPTCKEPAKRETNTMPQWAGSSWYYLRYMDPHNDGATVSTKAEKYWAPVDMYVGGAEHATRHLIYARFWHKFLYDIGVVSTREPFARLASVGLIQAEDGRKMSKRFGNVINPDDVVAEYGADAFRLYSMFMGPFENAIAWSTSSIAGTRRFIERVWDFAERVEAESHSTLDAPLHEMIKKVGDDIEAFKFNTAVSQMMIFLNAAEKEGAMGREQWSAFVRVLAPFTPHLSDELWEKLDGEGSVHLAIWPEYDPVLIVSTREVTVQVDGKHRASLALTSEVSEDEAVQAARALASVERALGGHEPARIIYIPGKVLNLVTR